VVGKKKGAENGHDLGVGRGGRMGVSQNGVYQGQKAFVPGASKGGGRGPGNWRSKEYLSFCLPAKAKIKKHVRTQRVRVYKRMIRRGPLAGDKTSATR